MEFSCYRKNMADAEDFQPLTDPAVDEASLKALRAAYRALRGVYEVLHERHHTRIEAALSELREENKKTGGDVPYGFQLAKDNKTLVEKKDEQAAIKAAVRLHEQGFSLRRIAKELQRLRFRPRDIPKEKRRPLKTKRIGEFDPTQIRRMIAAHKARTAPTE